MNINEEDVDLGLALGSTYYSARTRLNSRSGAGVNADSRDDMTFAASDPLSELVWSPHNGLSLKCADSSLSNKNPFDPWNVGIRIKDPSTSQSLKSKGSGDEKVVEDKLNTMLETERKSGDKASMSRSSGNDSNHELHASHGQCDGVCNLKMGEEGLTVDAIQDENTRDRGKQAPLSSHNGQIPDIAECCKMSTEQDILADNSEVNMEMKLESSPKGRHEFVVSSNEIVGSAVPVNSEPHAAKLCDAPTNSLPKLVSRQEPDDEVTSFSRSIDANKARNTIAIPAPKLMKLEFSAENDFGHLAAKDAQSSGETRLQRENSCPIDGSPMDTRICLYQEKGKAKAPSDGEVYGKSDDEDDSNESMESCNSIGLFSKGGIKRSSYGEEQLVGSKRLKKQIQASHGSTSFVRPDSSFMNWISNMVKGLSDSIKEGSSSLSLTLARSNDICGNNNNGEDITCNKPQDCESPKVGFQSMFQSLYSRNAKMPISGIQDNCSVDESKELVVADKKSLKTVPQRNIDNPCQQIILCDEEANQRVSRNTVGERSSGEYKASELPVFNRAKGRVNPSDSLCKLANSNVEDTILDTPLPISCMPSKGSTLPGLWITRLYNKAAKLKNCDQVTKETPVCSTEFIKPSGDVKSTYKQSYTQFPQESRTSEAMASVFAKRLDAFRHIIHPLEKMKSSQKCFFCGSSRHDLHTCPELTEVELDDLLVKISAFDRVEEPPSFCIKCFQFDHWASSCPSVPLQRHGRSQQKACGHRIQLCPLDDGIDEDYHKQAFTTHSSRTRVLTSDEFQRSTATNSEEELKNIQRFPLFNFIAARKTVTEGEMFHVITKLRLSRVDVLRWMNSNVSLSHLNGFFLRLRLGSFEAGLAETGYYAARITGDKIENISCKSKKSISVDVGGIKSSVGSQYVSNHDFLEDEIKAWWGRIVKTGGDIPSLDELNSKFEERKCLGF